MMMLEGIRDVKRIYAHGREEAPCPDGLAAALIIRDVFPEVEVRFIAYESKEHLALEPEPGLLFVDIAPPPHKVDAFLEARTLVLDHHRSAADIVRRFEAAGLGWYADKPGISAATLAYDVIWSVYQDQGRTNFESTVAHLARMMGIYDTWQKDNPDWVPARELASVLYFFPDWLDYDDPIRVLKERLDLGELLVAKDDAAVQALVDGAQRFVTEKGTRVAVIASTALISVAADAFPDADVVVGFMFRIRAGVPAVKLSFRSRKGGVVVRHIAEALGGGGHDPAASAWVELHASHRHPYAMIRAIMETR